MLPAYARANYPQSYRELGIINDQDEVIRTYFPRLIPENYPQSHEVIHIRSPLIHILMLSAGRLGESWKMSGSECGAHNTAQIDLCGRTDAAVRAVYRSRNVLMPHNAGLLFVFAAFVVIEIESIDKIAEERKPLIVRFSLGLF
jgi:hypothetical protein